MLLGLTVGVGVIVLVNLALIHLAQRGARQAAALVALLTLGVYGPYAILRWPGGDVFALHLAVYLLTSLVCGLLLERRSGGSRLHWGPAALGGFFIVVVIGGAVFVTVAERGLSPSVARWLLPQPRAEGPVTSVFPGVVARDFHKKEALYNHYLQQVERQRQRGWQVQKGWLTEPVAGQEATFRVTVQTRDSQPLHGATVTGQFLRPSASALDMALHLTELAPGVYETTLRLPVPGTWNLVLQIRQGQELHEISASTQIGAR